MSHDLARLFVQHSTFLGMLCALDTKNSQGDLVSKSHAEYKYESKTQLKTQGIKIERQFC